MAERQWKVGDRVRFAHQHPDGPVRTITALADAEPMVEIEGMSGQFGSDLFIAVPCQNPAPDATLGDVACPVYVPGDPRAPSHGACKNCGSPWQSHSQEALDAFGRSMRFSSTGAAARTLAEWIEHSRSEGSLHVAVPVEFAEYVHAILLGVEYQTREL